MATVRWIGTNGSWNTGSNWSGGSVPTASDIPVFDDSSQISVNGYDASAVTYTDISVKPTYKGNLGTPGDPLTVDVSNVFTMYGQGVACIGGGGTWGLNSFRCNTQWRPKNFAHLLTGNVGPNIIGKGGVYVESGNVVVNCTSKLRVIVTSGRRAEATVEANGSATLQNAWASNGSKLTLKRDVTASGGGFSIEHVTIIAVSGASVHLDKGSAGVGDQSDSLIFTDGGGRVVCTWPDGVSSIYTERATCYIGDATLDFSNANHKPIDHNIFLSENALFIDSPQGASTLALDLRKKYPF